LAQDLKGKPKLQAAVEKGVNDLFGESPKFIKVPKGTGLYQGGRRLAAYWEEGGQGQRVWHRLLLPKRDPESSTDLKDSSGKPVAVRGSGGYALYRHHCMHCHGVSGDGAGPTAAFLFPRPRDYRPGLFKFTSTGTGQKPAREDLKRTIKNGLHGTSMPSFETMMSAEEIEQVVDYVMFLSMRGQVETQLIDEASVSDEKDPNPLPADRVQEIAQNVFDEWKRADGLMMNPPARRGVVNRASIERGRDLFLGRTKEKLVCTTCHGPLGKGDGDQWIDEKFTYEVVFGGMDPEEIMKKRVYKGEAPDKLDKAAREKKEAELKTLHDLWAKSLDNWKQPLRPANLNRGVYKGGRRPLDLYWRVSNGITGTPMPGHAQAATPDRLWDVVNFVLALPYEPKLLTEAPPAPATSAEAPKVASRGVAAP
jgi:mono/diheme cytochrome c family protein